MSRLPSHFPFAVCPGTEKESITFRIVGTNDGNLKFAGVRGLYLWPSDPESKKGYTITYYWTEGDTSEERRNIVRNVFKEIENYSGIKFENPSDEAQCNIRIHLATDDRTPAWSAIGTTAEEILSGPTLSLPKEFTTAQAYHIVGHALGLEHEYDGKTVFENARHGELLKGRQLSNFPPLRSETPVKTIMRYYIDETQTQLSELDKAWFTINYPKKKTAQVVIDNIKKQAKILRIEQPVANDIAKLEKKPPAMRRLYNRYISEAWGEKYDNLSELLGALHIPQGSALDGVAFSALMHPMFEAGVTRIIEEQLVEDGLLSREDIDPPSAYSLDMTVQAPEAQHWIGELSGIVATLLPLVLRGAPPPGSSQAAHSLQAAPMTGPPEAQHWIGAVVGLLGSILPMVIHGVPPPPGVARAADYSALQVQQSVFSNLAELLKHPLLLTTVKEVAGRL